MPTDWTEAQMRTIAVEEHFVTPEFEKYTRLLADLVDPERLEAGGRRLLDFTDERLPAMEANGIDIAVLSLNSPGIQGEPDPVVAVDLARTVNDFLAGVIEANPDRFRGFAALPLQDPDAAVAELKRAVGELGFCGALVNAHTNGVYLDDPTLRDLWGQAEELDVPIYLHPSNGVTPGHVLSGHPELIGPIWSWGVDSASHTLRLIFAGVFDEFPAAKLLIGHMGEGLPYATWRLDSRWEFQSHRGIELARVNPSEYLRHNVFITTSGVCAPAPLQCAITEVGADRILFAVDYPFEEMSEAKRFLETAPIAEQERASISHLNAERLLKIDPAQ
jgi:2,3-dihydroxybenzoate decarboxylase